MSPFSHTQAVTLLAFGKPLEPSVHLSAKPEKELLFMTPVSNVPDIARYVMSIRPRHFIEPFLEAPFRRQK